MQPLSRIKSRPYGFSGTDPGSILVEIEGPSGAGKTTLVQALAGLSGSGRHYVDIAAVESSFEESTSLLANFMRNLAEPLNPLDAAFLFCARTAVRCRAISTLMSAKTPATLVVDRLRLSLYAQLRMAGVSTYLARRLTQQATNELQPDVTVLLDVSYAGHQQRLDGRRHEALQAHRFAEWKRYLHDGFDEFGAVGLRIDTTSISRDLVLAKAANALAIP